MRLKANTIVNGFYCVSNNSRSVPVTVVRPAYLIHLVNRLEIIRIELFDITTNSTIMAYTCAAKLHRYVQRISHYVSRSFIIYYYVSREFILNTFSREYTVRFAQLSDVLRIRLKRAFNENFGGKRLNGATCVFYTYENEACPSSFYNHTDDTRPIVRFPPFVISYETG